MLWNWLGLCDALLLHAAKSCPAAERLCKALNQFRVLRFLKFRARHCEDGLSARPTQQASKLPVGHERGRVRVEEVQLKAGMHTEHM